MMSQTPLLIFGEDMTRNEATLSRFPHHLSEISILQYMHYTCTSRERERERESKQDCMDTTHCYCISSY